MLHLAAARIYGVDFTSSPSIRKPITVAECQLAGDLLSVENIVTLTTFKDFEHLLELPGSWLGGFDFPFGQPRKLICNANWPGSWSQYVETISRMSKEEFVNFLRKYQATRPSGDKRHFRLCDKMAGACSPMQLDFIPVAKMFYEGSPRLLKSSCSIYPFYSRTEGCKTAVEAYPSLVARNCLGKMSYKNDSPRKRTEGMLHARSKIIDIISGVNDESHFQDLYGLVVALPEEVRSCCITDGTGDWLDSVLCAIQAAWSYQRRDADFGIRWDCDSLEGWIVDPVIHRQTPSQVSLEN